MADKEAPAEETVETVAIEKRSRKAQPKEVVVQNRTARALVVSDANGHGLHLPPKGRLTIPEELAGSEVQRFVSRGALRVTSK